MTKKSVSEELSKCRSITKRVSNELWQLSEAFALTGNHSLADTMADMANTLATCTNDLQSAINDKTMDDLNHGKQMLGNLLSVAMKMDEMENEKKTVHVP